MKIKEKLLGLIVLVFIFGGIFISSIMDVWCTDEYEDPVEIVVVVTDEKEGGNIYSGGHKGSGSEEEHNESEDTKTEETEKEVVESETDSNVLYNDGFYTGISRGYKSDIEVKVEIKSDIILSVSIVSHKESRGYYEEVFATMPIDIVESQSTNVDTISGATFTSEAVIDATNQAIDKAKK